MQSDRNGTVMFASLARVAWYRRMFALLVVASPTVACPVVAQRFPSTMAITVIDSVSKLPLADVNIVDLRSGRSVQTTRSGTAVLSLLDSAGVLITLRRVGYRPLTRLVQAANHEGSITLTLVPLPQPVPGVVTEGSSGPTEILRTLEVNGFYDRRRRTAAPASAFVTEEKLSRLSSLADVRHVSGRALCTQNLYVDGMRVRVDRSFYSWLRPDRVAGIELYTHAPEIPAQYNVTLPSGSSSICATLIWTK